MFRVKKLFEVEALDSGKFDLIGQISSFSEVGGSILACGTCLKIRKSTGACGIAHVPVKQPAPI